MEQPLVSIAVLISRAEQARIYSHLTILFRTDRLTLSTLSPERFTGNHRLAHRYILGLLFSLARQNY